jgi:hypothetical protein
MSFAANCLMGRIGAERCRPIQLGFAFAHGACDECRRLTKSRRLSAKRNCERDG